MHESHPGSCPYSSLRVSIPSGPGNENFKRSCLITPTARLCGSAEARGTSTIPGWVNTQMFWMSLADRQRGLKSQSLFPNGWVSDSKFRVAHNTRLRVCRENWNATHRVLAAKGALVISSFPLLFHSPPPRESAVLPAGSFCGLDRAVTAIPLLTYHHKSALCGTCLKSRLAHKLWLWVVKFQRFGPT